MQALLTATSDGFDRSSEEERTERLRGRQLTESATLQLRSAFASDLRVWQVWHQIDEASPLYRIRDSLKSDLKWVDVSLTAFDQVYMQEVRMHANYTSSDLVEGARFDEMASLDFDGRRHTVDLSKIDAHHYIDARGRRQRTFKRLNVGAMLAKVQWGGVEGAHHRGSVSGASQPHHLNPDGTARRSFEMTSMFRRASRSVRPAPPKLAEALRDAERNREVLVHYEGVGDYAAAVGVVAAAALAPLSDGELRDGAAVRAKVRALNKLGEYKWRYRVVDEGGSPRDEAIAVLEEARGLIAAAIERTRSRGRQLRGGAGRPSYRKPFTALRASSSTATTPRTMANLGAARRGALAAPGDARPRRRGRRDVQLDGDAAAEAAPPERRRGSLRALARAALAARRGDARGAAR